MPRRAPIRRPCSRWRSPRPTGPGGLRGGGRGRGARLVADRRASGSRAPRSRAVRLPDSSSHGSSRILGVIRRHWPSICWLRYSSRSRIASSKASAGHDLAPDLRVERLGHLLPLRPLRVGDRHHRQAALLHRLEVRRLGLADLLPEPVPGVLGGLADGGLHVGGDPVPVLLRDEGRTQEELPPQVGHVLRVVEELGDHRHLGRRAQGLDEPGLQRGGDLGRGQRHRVEAAGAPDLDRLRVTGPGEQLQLAQVVGDRHRLLREEVHPAAVRPVQDDEALRLRAWPRACARIFSWTQ